VALEMSPDCVRASETLTEFIQNSHKSKDVAKCVHQMESEQDSKVRCEKTTKVLVTLGSSGHSQKKWPPSDGTFPLAKPHNCNWQTNYISRVGQWLCDQLPIGNQQTMRQCD